MEDCEWWTFAHLDFCDISGAKMESHRRRLLQHDGSSLDDDVFQDIQRKLEWRIDAPTYHIQHT